MSDGSTTLLQAVLAPEKRDGALSPHESEAVSMRWYLLAASRRRTGAWLGGMPQASTARRADVC